MFSHKIGGKRSHCDQRRAHTTSEIMDRPPDSAAARSRIQRPLLVLPPNLQPHPRRPSRSLEPRPHHLVPRSISSHWAKPLRRPHRRATLLPRRNHHPPHRATSPGRPLLCTPARRHNKRHHDQRRLEPPAGRVDQQRDDASARKAPTHRGHRKHAPRILQIRSSAPLHALRLRSLSHPLPQHRRPKHHPPAPARTHQPSPRRASPDYHLCCHLPARRHYLSRVRTQTPPLPRCDVTTSNLLLGHQHHAHPLRPRPLPRNPLHLHSKSPLVENAFNISGSRIEQRCLRSTSVLLAGASRSTMRPNSRQQEPISPVTRKISIAPRSTLPSTALTASRPGRNGRIPFLTTSAFQSRLPGPLLMNRGLPALANSYRTSWQKCKLSLAN